MLAADYVWQSGLEKAGGCRLHRMQQMPNEWVACCAA